MMKKTIHRSVDKMQKYFTYVSALFFQTKQCNIVTPWSTEKWVLFWLIASQNHLLSCSYCYSLFPVIFYLLRHFSRIRASDFRDTNRSVKVNNLFYYLPTFYSVLFSLSVFWELNVPSQWFNVKASFVRDPALLPSVIAVWGWLFIKPVS